MLDELLKVALQQKIKEAKHEIIENIRARMKQIYDGTDDVDTMFELLMDFINRLEVDSFTAVRGW